MRRYRDFCASNGEEGCFVWDDIAVLYLLYPERFTALKKTDAYGNKINCLFYKSE